MLYLLLIFLSLTLQTVQADETPLHIRFFSVNDGLPQQAVTAITQDRAGFMWLGTFDGLCRFDGITHHNFYHNNNDTSSISSNRILTLLKDSFGRLLVGTEGSPCLNLYNPDLDSFIQFSNPDWKDCRCLVEDDEHQIWMGTSHGVCVLRLDSLNKITYERPDVDALRRSKVKHIRLSKDRKNVWVLTGKRIYHFNLKMELLEYFEDEAINGAEDLFFDSYSQLYMLHNHGLYYVRYGELIKTNVNLYLTAMYELPDGTFIVGTNGQGFYRLTLLFDGNFTVSQISNLDTFSFFQSNLIRNFYVDNQNNLWIGSGHDGVAIVAPKKCNFSHLPILQGKAHAFVRSIFKDSEGYLWIGLKLGGLYRFKNGQYTRFNIDSHCNFNAIREDSQKRIWILTSKEIFIYYDKKLHLLKDIAGIPSDLFEQIHSASAIIEDNNGAIWIGGTGKMVRIKGLFTTDCSVHYYNASYTEDIYCMNYDDKGRLWIGSRSNGLTVATLNATSDILQTQPLSTRSNQIWNIALSKSNQHVWVATDFGLDSFDFETLASGVVSLDKNEKLINRKILSVTEVSDGSIWVSTSQGLLHYNPQTKYYREYYSNDGLCSNCLTEASFLDEDGVLYIGSIDGLNYFNPLKTSDVRCNSQIQFTAFRIHNSLVKAQQKVNGSIPLKCAINDANKLYISYRNNSFSIEFIAPRYIYPKKMYYAYKLEGVDKDWVYIHSNNQMANYNNIEAGKYIFKVKATDINGLWDNPERSIIIVVDKAPWNTWWAYLIYLTAILAIVTLLLKHYFLQYKLKRDLQIANLQREHEQVVNEMTSQFHANISHEIRTSLALVITPLNDIISEVENMIERPKLEIINRNIDYLNNLVTKFLDLQKTDKGAMPLYVKETNISLLLEEICTRFKIQAEKQKIGLQLICESTSLIGYLDEDKIIKIVSNLVSNAIKFNQAGGDVVVFAEMVNDTIEIAVEDTGCGIAADDINHIFERYYQNRRRANQGVGIGLSLVYQLVKLHKGTITVKSKPDGGQTLFTVKIPISKDLYNEDELVQEKAEFHSIRIESNNKNEYKNTIMIVEDNLDMCAYLESCFSKQFNVLCKQHVNEAIDTIVKVIPDLILSDMNFEGDEKSGLDLCDAVKENIMTCHIPILILSAKDSSQDIAASYEHGAEDYILKPFSMDILVHKINNIIKYRKTQVSTFSENTEAVDKKVNDPFYDKLLALIHANQSNAKFGILDICNDLNISRTQLYRKMKSITETPISTLIRNSRFENAYQLLSERKYTVSEVMFKVGISSNSYFTKTFKEYYNILPSELIKEN